MSNQKIDSNKYIEFVRQTTSPASSDLVQLLSRMTELKDANADVPHLLSPVRNKHHDRFPL